MSSEKRIAASRANGRKSRGPATPEGKAISSQNAIRHGLLSNTVTIPGESLARFEEMLAAMILERCPDGDRELTLVENLAVCKWRQRRTWSLESSGIGEEMRNQESSPDIAEKDAPVRASLAVRHLADNTRLLDLMNRYDARFSREYHRIEKILQEIQNVRQNGKISKRT